MASQQSQTQGLPVKTEHNLLGTPTSTQNSLGKENVTHAKYEKTVCTVEAKILQIPRLEIFLTTPHILYITFAKSITACEHQKSF